MRVLVTNDDGIESEGLHALAQALTTVVEDVVVAAPVGDASGSSVALGVFHADARIDVKRVEVPGCDAPAWAVSGPPGLCTLAARLGAFGPEPDVIVSGINAGLNTGRAILHSGTVGAALTGQNFGAKGLAVSVDARRTLALGHSGEHRPRSARSRRRRAGPIRVEPQRAGVAP